MKLCLDLLTAVNYPKIAAEGFVKDYGLGIIWKATGLAVPKRAIRAVLATGKCKVVRVHLWWKDNHNDADAFTAADFPETLRLFDEVIAFFAEFPDVQLYISPWLENRADTATLTRLFRKLKKRCPRGVQLVNSGNNMPALPDVLREVHHSTSPADIFSFDGEGFSKSKCDEYKKIHKNAKLFFAWDWIFNQRHNEADTTPRPQRTLKPTPAQIRAIAKAMK